MGHAWRYVAATAVLGVGAWMGAGIYTGVKAEAALQSLANPNADRGRSPWRVDRVDHHRGLIQSDGQIGITYRPGCAAQPDEEEDISLELHYSVTHLPLHVGWASVQWRITPRGESAKPFEALFGTGAALSGQGAIRYSGAFSTDLNLPRVDWRRAGETLELAPSRGTLTVRDSALDLEWAMERAVARAHGQALEIKGLTLAVDLKDRYKGTGSGTLAVAQASTGLGSLDGLSIEMSSLEQGDRLDSTFTTAIHRIEGGGKTLSDLRMQWALRGLHTASAETLMRIAQDSCGLEALTAQERKTAGQALESLLVKGFSFGMPQLAGATTGGTLKGSFMVELAAAKGNTPALAEQLRANGQLELTGQALTPEQREMAVATGFAQLQGEGLLASFDYSRGLLKVNQRAMDASWFESQLRGANDNVRLALASLRDGAPPQAEAAAQQEPQAEPAAAPEADDPTASASASAVPSPAPAPAPEPAPAAPAKTTDCDSLSACVQGTLAAARDGDVDQVRRLATRIDTLPRPDLGNKAEGRHLNASALDALKRGDTAAAITLLRQAQRENPQDVEVAANLGYALNKVGDGSTARGVLEQALLLDARRSATWGPLGEAYALSGLMDEAKAAMWVGFQWSSRREKLLSVYLEQARKETRPALRQLYTHMAHVAEAELGQQTSAVSR